MWQTGNGDGGNGDDVDVDNLLGSDPGGDVGRAADPLLRSLLSRVVFVFNPEPLIRRLQNFIMVFGLDVRSWNANSESKHSYFSNHSDHNPESC